ncbi:secreted protein containing Peptidyl-prolyl cis-trans isomerase, PpiC-type domain [methanotrophic bacterial endosymbiont of Bathymodiolus sp.]|nr:secreted protein containing Peptidyl-prolyl cis-trans isomerase, PpiC-type domain [methanotrophic bacterial endosymbiont of Bathymodiolus sp.]
MKQALYIFLLFSLFSTASYANKVLVTIGENGQVTEQQLEAAMQAAPFATQFPAMDEKDQAYLRGDMLLRLARAEALYQEAIATGKNQGSIFQQEMSNFKTALLAQRYVESLRQKIQIPEAVEQQFLVSFKGNGDALIAARSAYIAKHFTSLKNDNIKQLIQQANIQTYFERLDKDPGSETILAKGDGLLIKYDDLVVKEKQPAIDQQRNTDKVNEWIKLTVMAKAAQAQGENVEPQLQEYAHHLATRLLLAEKELQWIPDEKVLHEYFQLHPDIGYIPERRQIGQIVLATKPEAEAMRSRILAGESLFELAGQYSIDAYGRQRSGDMGWLKEGSATKEIEQAIKNLQNNELSEVIKTDKGWHLVLIVNRKPSERKDYAAIKDRVRQKFIAEKMIVYLQEVMAKHPLQWQMDDYVATGKFN